MYNSGKQTMLLTFGGGWATDYGPSFPGPIQNGVLALPFLANADNVRYELDGAPHKFGGTTRLNSTQVTETAVAQTFEGITDYWTQGTGGSETQKRVAVVGTRIMKEDVDGTWDEIGTGFQSAAQPCFETFNDDLLIATDTTADVPQVWTQSGNVAALGGTPPNFSFMVKHKNRMWAAGVAGNPSRLYYSVNLDHEDWAGSGSGSIDIDPDDGDRITGLRSNKNDLFVFKGPNKLSIHRITGSAPTGTDAYARVPFVGGLGAVNHNGIFQVGDDIYFASPRGLHSLAVTQKYGDYLEAYLSAPFLSYYQESLASNLLGKCWGVNYQGRGLAIWSFAKSGSTAKGLAFLYDYRFQPGRWSTLGKDSTYTNLNCLALVQTSARRHVLMAGGNDGYVRTLDTSDRSIDTTGAYTGTAETPFLSLGSSAYIKTLEDGWLSLAPKGTAAVTFSHQYDTQTAVSQSLSQAGGNTLG